MGAGRAVLGAAIENQRVEWASLGTLVTNAGAGPVQHVLAQFVLSLLVAAVGIEVLLTGLLGTTPGKALVLLGVRGVTGSSLRRRPATAALRGVLAVAPGGAAACSWMLWLAGMPIRATAGLVLGGGFLLVDGVTQLVSGAALHDRLTRTAVVGLRGRHPAGRRPRHGTGVLVDAGV